MKQVARLRYNEIDWSDEMKEFLVDNFFKMTNPELAKALGLKLTSVRTKCYQLGLKRMEQEYWDDDQVNFLIENYREMGDVEIAEIFNYVCPKDKKWTCKHIEKKRRYLKIKRTAEEIAAIKERNTMLGCFKFCSVHMWKTRGVSPNETIKYWKRNDRKEFPVIKINGSYVHWAPYTWEKLYGPIAKGMNVVFKDDDPYNRDPSNLEVITNAELAKRNGKKSSGGLSDNYIAGILSFNQPELRELVKQHPKLIEVKRTQLKLNRIINEQQKLSQTN